MMLRLRLSSSSWLVALACLVIPLLIFSNLWLGIRVGRQQGQRGHRERAARVSEGAAPSSAAVEAAGDTADQADDEGGRPA